MGTAVVGAVLLAVVVLAVRSLLREKGGCSCGGECGSCGGACHSKRD